MSGPWRTWRHSVLDNVFTVQELVFPAGCGLSEGYSYPVSHLTSEGEAEDMDEKLRTAVSLVTRLAGVTVTRTRCALIG